jgi:Tannase and feruloyl esterase
MDSPYMVPGMYHCNGGPRATSEDFLTPLMQWVEDGVRPDRVVINYHTTSDNSVTSPIAMTRPVWPYPFIATYTGKGSPTDAANFAKTSPDQRFSDRFNWVGIGTYRPGLQLWCDWRGAKLECSEMRKQHRDRDRDGRDHDRDDDRDRNRR